MAPRGSKLHWLLHKSRFGASLRTVRGAWGGPFERERDKRRARGVGACRRVANPGARGLCEAGFAVDAEAVDAGVVRVAVVGVDLERDEVDGGLEGLPGLEGLDGGSATRVVVLVLAQHSRLGVGRLRRAAKVGGVRSQASSRGANAKARAERESARASQRTRSSSLKLRDTSRLGARASRRARTRKAFGAEVQMPAAFEWRQSAPCMCSSVKDVGTTRAESCTVKVPLPPPNAKHDLCRETHALFRKIRGLSPPDRFSKIRQREFKDTYKDTRAKRPPAGVLRDGVLCATDTRVAPERVPAECSKA